MNRNIVTPEDARRAATKVVRTAGGRELTADDYWTRVLKYVPVEIVSAYLLLKNMLEGAYVPGSFARLVSLEVLFTLGLLGTWAYAKLRLQIVRNTQIAVTVVGYCAWAFAAGSFLAEFGWYSPWMATASIVIFGVVVQIVKLPPLADVK
jgi:hypothetical protein